MPRFRIEIAVDARQAIEGARQVRGALRGVERGADRTRRVIRQTERALRFQYDARGIRASVREYDRLGRAAQQVIAHTRAAGEALRRGVSTQGLRSAVRGFVDLERQAERTRRVLIRSQEQLQRPFSPGALRGALRDFRSASTRLEALQSRIFRTAQRLQRQPIAVPELRRSVAEARNLTLEVNRASQQFVRLRSRARQLRENQGLRRLAFQARQTERDMRRLRGQFDQPLRVRGVRRAERDLRRLGNEAGRTGRLVRRSFFFLTGGVSAFLLARELVQLSDVYINLNNRLRLVSSTLANQQRLQQETLMIANATRQAWDLTAETYVRAAQATQRLGRGQQELLRFTLALNQAVAISGATSQEARAGLIQLSQGLASGVLRGDELRSVMEQLRRVNTVLLDHFRRTTAGAENFSGSLKDLAAQGLITSQFVIEAFLAAAPELAEEFSLLEITIGQAFTRLRNSFVALVGEINVRTNSFSALARILGGGTGETTGGLAGAVAGLGRHLRTLVQILGIVAAILAGRLLRSLIGASAAFIRTQRDVFRVRLALGAMEGAAGLAARRVIILSGAMRVLRGTLAFLGGPAGLVLLVAFGIYEWVRANREASNTLETLSQDVDVFARSLEALNRVQLQGIEVRILDQVDVFQEQATDLQRQIEGAQGGSGLPLRRVGPRTRSAGAVEHDRRELIRLQAEENTIQQQIENAQRRLGIVRQQLDGELSAGQREEIAEASNFAVLLGALTQENALLRQNVEQRQVIVALRQAEKDLGRDLTRGEIFDVVAVVRERQALEQRDAVVQRLTGSNREYERTLTAVDDALQAGLITSRQAAAERERLREQFAPNLDDYLDDLREERTLLRAVGDERRVLQAFETARRTLGVDQLDQGQQQSIRDEVLLTSAQERRAQVLQQLDGGQRQYQQQLQAINELVSAGRISEDDASRFAERLRLQLERGTPNEILNSLRQENALLSENADRRAALQALRRREQELSREFTEAELQAFIALSNQNRALERQVEIYDELAGPARDYAVSLQALNEVIRQYPQLADQAAEAQVRLEIAFLETQRSFSAGARRAILRLAQDYTDAGANIDRAITNSFQAAENALVQFVTTGKLEIGDLVNTIIAEFARLLIVQRILGPLAGAFGLGGGAAGALGGSQVAPPSFQHGGQVRGAGTGTSDSIPAFVSNGEFIVNAMAARANLSLLHAINRSRRYQTGGLVAPTAAAPRGGVQINVYQGVETESGRPEAQQREGLGGDDIYDIFLPIMQRATGSGDLDDENEGRYGIVPQRR